MKIVVFIFIVIANLSDNGKASVDSFLPANANVLLEDTTKTSGSSCLRPCKFNVKPRRCNYRFRIGPSTNNEGQVFLSVNEQSPGPAINVCVNDIVVVEVQNRIPDHSLTIHWHGVEQKGTPWMDGVPMLTQCPIDYGATYKYAFRASAPGTYFYHADSVAQQIDGVFGALVVNQPQPMEPHSSLYDYDRSVENTLLISATYPDLMTGSLEDLSQKKASGLRVNGEQDSYKVTVMEGFGHRLRLINAAGLECPVAVAVDQHEVTAIATDGRPVRATTADKLLLYPGERMDLVVRATQKPHGYWIRVFGLGDTCAGLQASAMLLYSGFNYTSMLYPNKHEVQTVPDLETGSILIGQNMESYSDMQQKPTSDVKTVYLGIDRSITQDVRNDFRYISDAIPKKPFYPAPLALNEKGVVQINGKSFLYPNVPYLQRPKDMKSDLVCKVGEEQATMDPQCFQLLEVAENDVVEIALVNEGRTSNDNYTFHMHGYGVQVVSQWRTTHALSKELFMQMDKEGKIARNLVNPPVKDTFTVPNKGFTIIRFTPSHAGAWLLECRSCSPSSLPTAIVVSTGQSLPKSVLDALPKCGSYRPPDVLLN